MPFLWVTIFEDGGRAVGRGAIPIRGRPNPFEIAIFKGDSRGEAGGVG